MEISLFLAKALGIWMTIIGIVVLTSPSNVATITREYFERKSTVFLGASLALLIGSLLVAGHNIWEWNWRLIITLFGWLSLIKGIFILMFPQEAEKFYIRLLEKIDFRIPGAFYTAIGLLLAWIGFFKH